MFSRSEEKQGKFQALNSFGPSLVVSSVIYKRKNFFLADPNGIRACPGQDHDTSAEHLATEVHFEEDQ